MQLAQVASHNARPMAPRWELRFLHLSLASAQQTHGQPLVIIISQPPQQGQHHHHLTITVMMMRYHVRSNRWVCVTLPLITLVNANVTSRIIERLSTNA